MPGAAIIGLGMMGQGMARNILDAGIALKGFDLSERARDRFSQAGGIAVATAAEAAQGCDLLLVMVATGAQVQAALFDSGAAAALDSGSVVILGATIAPSEARELATRLAAAGHMMIDAPVSGGQTGADAGTLTVMASGPDAAFDRAMSLLDAVSETVHRLGPEPGMGATYKVVHQLAAGIHLVAAAELMALAVKTGCDPKTVYDIVTTSAGASWMFADRVPRMLQADPQATSTVDIFIKDLGLVVNTGHETGVSLPLAEAAQRMMLAAGDMGLGSQDDSAVVRVYEAQTGKPVHES